jgi:HSP20 family protein
MKNEEESNFIELRQDEDMYLLTINLNGVDLRELSIRYDPGIIEVNVNRSEIQKNGFGMLSNNMLVKRAYNRQFENIEEIDTEQIFKSIDNGILSIRMPKKYVLENSIEIVEVDSIEVDSYEDNVDN